MSAYYNEIDPLAAQTIREAIAAGAIAPGEVDERDIRDVRPDELAGFTQCHFFAGGGIWSYALRRAGWSDDRPIWTGSCPCQPFSTAGKGNGFADERHLWPAFHWLIAQCGPELVAGEQVADKGADPWIDLVQADLEALDYAFGCVPLASAGFGAPNPRHRAYWLAYANGEGLERRLGLPERPDQQLAGPSGLADRLGDPVRHGTDAVRRDGDSAEGSAVRIDGYLPGAGASPGYAGPAGGLGNADGEPRERHAGSLDRAKAQVDGAWIGFNGALRVGPELAGDAIRLADTESFCSGAGLRDRGQAEERRDVAADGDYDGHRDPGPVNGFWRDADWLYCRDPGGPRWRPVDAGTFPLAPSHPARVGGLRISGNAINAQVATAFVEAVIGHLAGTPIEAAA